MKIKLLATAAIIAISSSVAFADMSTETGSIKIIGGISKLKRQSINLGSGVSAKTKPKQSPVFGLEYGFKPAENFRAGLEVGFRRNMKIKSDNIANTGVNMNLKTNSISVMANFYYDIGEFGAFKPYLGAGVGFARNKAKHLNLTDTATNKTFVIKGKAKNEFAWQLMAGANVALNDSLDLDLSYRYANLGKMKLKNDAGTKTVNFGKRLQAHEFLAGFKFNI